MTEWTCQICGLNHAGLPTCFGADAPWPALVPESEFGERVELTDDQCVVDGTHFFVRGHVKIPIIGLDDQLEFSVWSSLSEESFCDMTFHWSSEGRARLPPYFGRLCSPIPVYDETLHLPLDVKCRAPGLTPVFEVKKSDHPLAVDQQIGIPEKTWHRYAMQLLSFE